MEGVLLGLMSLTRQFYAFPLGSLPAGNYHGGTTDVCLSLGTWNWVDLAEVCERVIGTASSVYGF
jgi:hypothetical protein